MVNYSQFCLNLLKNLSEKQKAVIIRRYGLKGGQRETLELIGKAMGVTRERVRQIESDGFAKIKPEAEKYPKVFSSLKEYLKKRGGLKKEDLLLSELGKNKRENQVNFLLNLNGNFEKFSESRDYHSFWTFDKSYFQKAKTAIDSALKLLNKKGSPTELKDLSSSGLSDKTSLVSYLEISKKIQKNSEGLYGLIDWPEIKPRGIKDKAFLVFKKEQKPLHFNEVAGLINSALPQTVHNELIKDSRFVLVGRGIYALKEWGYQEGPVKEVIHKTLKEAKSPLPKEEILRRVLKQRMVKPNTVFLNLGNKKYFSKDNKNFYKINTKEI